MPQTILAGGPAVRQIEPWRLLTAAPVQVTYLGYLGTLNPTLLLTRLAQFFTVIYFAYFLLMPLYSAIDSTKPVPERVVYHGHQ